MLPISLTAIILRVIFELKLIDVVRVVTGGGPGGATDTVSLLIYREGIQRNERRLRIRDVRVLSASHHHLDHGGPVAREQVGRKVPADIHLCRPPLGRPVLCTVAEMHRSS